MLRLALEDNSDAPYNDPEARYGGAALVVALIANSAMVAILWNYFHLASKKALNPKNPSGQAESAVRLKFT